MTLKVYAQDTISVLDFASEIIELVIEVVKKIFSETKVFVKQAYYKAITLRGPPFGFFTNREGKED